MVRERKKKSQKVYDQSIVNKGNKICGNSISKKGEGVYKTSYKFCMQSFYKARFSRKNIKNDKHKNRTTHVSLNITHFS